MDDSIWSWRSVAGATAESWWRFDCRRSVRLQADRPRSIPNPKLLGNGLDAIDLLERRAHVLRVHGDRTVPLRIEPVGSGYRVNVAVEHQTNDLAARIHDRTAGIATDDVGRRNEVRTARKLEARLRVEPAFRQRKRRSARCALVHPVEPRERFDPGTGLRPPIDRAVGQPKRKG